MSQGTIYQRWLDAKAKERAAIEVRRSLEDELMNQFGSNLEGTRNVSDSGYKIKIVERVANKVDGEKLQELAHEAGLSEHLGQLFRWVPSINMAAWQAADESITQALLEAITTKASRPSFTIEKEEV